MTETLAQPTLRPWLAADGNLTPDALESWVQSRIDRHRQAIDRLLAENVPHTTENTLRGYDDAVFELAAAGSQVGLLHSVHPDKSIRDTAEAQAQKISQVGVELALNQKVYQALTQIPAEDADAATQHYLERTLLQYRLAGVDKDDATRARLKELQDQATVLSLTFGRNVQEGGNLIVLYNTQELVPNDYAPYPAQLTSRAEEVSEEDSPVEILEPASRVLNAPNRITRADFDGWVEQRGSKFFSEWDQAYEPVTNRSWARCS